MNSLSWLLYGADVVRSLGVVFGTGAFVGLIAIPVAWISAAWMHDFGDMDDEGVSAIRGKWKVGAIIAPIFALLWAFTPSQNTIMLIAASQVGETILANPQAQQIGGEAGALAKDSLSVLRKFINEQLAEPTPAPAK